MLNCCIVFSFLFNIIKFALKLKRNQPPRFSSSHHDYFLIVHLLHHENFNVNKANLGHTGMLPLTLYFIQFIFQLFTQSIYSLPSYIIFYHSSTLSGSLYFTISESPQDVLSIFMNIWMFLYKPFCHFLSVEENIFERLSFLFQNQLDCYRSN